MTTKAPNSASATPIHPRGPRRSPSKGRRERRLGPLVAQERLGDRAEPAEVFRDALEALGIDLGIQVGEIGE